MKAIFEHYTLLIFLLIYIKLEFHFNFCSVLPSFSVLVVDSNCSSASVIVPSIYVMNKTNLNLNFRAQMSCYGINNLIEKQATNFPLSLLKSFG